MKFKNDLKKVKRVDHLHNINRLIRLNYFIILLYLIHNITKRKTIGHKVPGKVKPHKTAPPPPPTKPQKKENTISPEPYPHLKKIKYKNEV